MQLAARYDAIARRKLIVMIKEFKTRHVPKTQIEILLASIQTLADQEKKILAIETTVDNIKKPSSLNPTTGEKM